MLRLTQVFLHDRDRRSEVLISVDQIAVIDQNRTGDTRIRLKSGENFFVLESFTEVSDAIEAAQQAAHNTES